MKVSHQPDVKRVSVAFRSCGALIATICVAIVAGGLYFTKVDNQDDNQVSSGIDDNKMAGSGRRKPVERKDPSDTKLERILRGSVTGSSAPVVESYIDRQNIRFPVTILGVNEAAKEYYNLSDEQCEGINQIVDKARQSLASTVMSKIIVERNAEGRVDSVHYAGDAAAYSATKKELFAQLQSIAGKDFATAGVSVLKSDPRFLSGGEHSIDFYLTDGPRDRDPQFPKMELIRLEFLSQSGSRLEALTMTEEELKSQYQIDIRKLLNGSD
jgi:hypothetical protein